jgi:ABC-type multidrug transport system permease subunit
MSEMAWFWVFMGIFLLVMLGFMTFIFPSLTAKRKH